MKLKTVNFEINKPSFIFNENLITMIIYFTLISYETPRQAILIYIKNKLI